MSTQTARAVRLAADCPATHVARAASACESVPRHEMRRPFAEPDADPGPARDAGAV